MAISVRNLVIGSGRPKICVPIVAQDETEIMQQIAEMKEKPVDMVEWRMDFLNDFNQADVLLKKMRIALNHTPILATFRTQKEGGHTPFSEKEYEQLMSSILATNCADLLDIELFISDEVRDRLVKLAQMTGTKVVMSNHDFDQTPSKEVIQSRLLLMEKLGADICKIAVMPQNSGDVLRLLEATNELKNEVQVPLVTMAMGSLGVISRISGELFGSALTFGSLNQASAPGQLPIEALKQALECLEQ
ncbi:type I 3-dehydroquinate dehydratase [Vagococcus entomophilus]|uniref:3-dehydroquinate dehydratase n=1 Tax=Vagococcus entomophilus TaxID=1160095 RepID=A0A430AKL6_9ENTE|nr:type I 3-dehydroquinate dehydratase [Vagococcus entomophilus]RSU08660.1 type I 3-dehydroquinate dehydratase [Vagococcus entomophilus]